MGRHFGTTEGGLYYTLRHGLVQFDELPDWYGINGIKFQFINTQTDPRIWYEGKDCSCFDVEDTMWERFYEDMGEDAMDALTETERHGIFASYMKEHEDDVRKLCTLVLS